MDKALVARTVALIIVMLNAVLTLLGIPFVIPAEFADQIAAITVVGFGLYAAIKNDFFKKKDKSQ